MNQILGLLLLVTGGGAFFWGPQDGDAGGQPLPISHPDPKFRMTVPRGYKAISPKPPGVDYAFQRLDGQALAITVSVLDGRIDPDSEMKESDMAAGLQKLPPGAQLRLSREAWGAHQIQVMESSFTSQGVEVFSLVAQVPILPRAVQISIGGQRILEKQAREDLKAVLRTFHGTTHWLTPNQRILAWVSGGSAILSWLLLIVYGIAYAVSWKGGSLKAWKFRVGYLAVTLLSFAVALVSGAIYEMSKGDSRNNTSFYVVSATAFVVACTTAQLFQKGRQQAKAESTPSPTP